MTIRRSKRVNPLLENLKRNSKLVGQKLAEHKVDEDLIREQVDAYMRMPSLREKLSKLVKDQK